MSQETERYQLIRNDNNTFAIRGSASGGQITIDDDLSTTSSNPVENQVITQAINDLDSDITDVSRDLATHMVPHSYTANTTYASSDVNHDQLLADLTQNRDITISPYIYKQSQYSVVSNIETYVYVSAVLGEMRSITITYNTTTEAITISTITTQTISSISASQQGSEVTLL